MSIKQSTIYIDFDSTLVDDSNTPYPEIGPPIPHMVEFAKRTFKRQPICIFTARLDNPPLERMRQVELLRNWCLENEVLDNEGLTPVITNVKGMDCERIYDDRAVSVRRNRGIVCDLNDDRHLKTLLNGIAVEASGEGAIS